MLRVDHGQKQLASCLPDFTVRLPDGSQGGSGEFGHGHVIKAHNGQIVRHMDVVFRGDIDYTKGHLIICREDCSRAFFWWE